MLEAPPQHLLEAIYGSGLLSVVFYPNEFCFYRTTETGMLLPLGILIVSLIGKFFAFLLLSVFLLSLTTWRPLF